VSARQKSGVAKKIKITKMKMRMMNDDDMKEKHNIRTRNKRQQ
jgi:hypothetical protein